MCPTPWTCRTASMPTRRSPTRSGRRPRGPPSCSNDTASRSRARCRSRGPALVARRRGARVGPVIAFLGEYDALPEVGHGCGHNLMCSSSAGAAIVTARELGDDFAGEVRFIGTPAEEAGERQGDHDRARCLRRRRRGAPDPPVGPDKRRDRLPGDHRRRRDLPWEAGPRQLRPVAREERARCAWCCSTRWSRNGAAST